MLNNIKSFGLNVIPDKQRTVEAAAESVGDAFSSVWEPVIGYLKENENVFSGQVQNDIEKINHQTMRIAMTMGNAGERRSLNFES